MEKISHKFERQWTRNSLICPVDRSYMSLVNILMLSAFEFSQFIRTQKEYSFIPGRKNPDNTWASMFAMQREFQCWSKMPTTKNIERQMISVGDLISQKRPDSRFEVNLAQNPFQKNSLEVIFVDGAIDVRHESLRHGSHFGTKLFTSASNVNFGTNKKDDLC